MRKKKLKKVYRIKNFLFFTVLGVLAVIGAMWFLRPDVSELEKRELTPFPKVTFKGLMDGSFTGGVDKWYSDTYPLREMLIGGSRRLQSLYGDRSQQIIIKPDTPADDIPDPSEETPGPTDSSQPTESTGTPDPSDSSGAADPTGGTAATEPPASSTEPSLPDGTVTTPGEVMGSIYVSGDSAYSLYYFNKTGTERYANFVNHTHEALGSGVQVYSLIVPLSSGVILDQSLLTSVGASDQRAAIEYINSKLDPAVHGLNVFDTLKRHNAEYLYFRTDHHWTALGSYYAYTDFCASKGVTAHTLDQFQEKEFPGFLGTFYSETLSKSMENNPDTVHAWVPMGTNKMTYTDFKGQEINWNIVRDVSGYKKSGKYYCFSGSDEPYSYAHNPQITDGSAVVVIKDSFGNAFIPWLVDHYEHIYWIDFRYYKGTLPDLVREKDINDVIFCLNIYNTTSVKAVPLLERLVP